MTERIQLLRTKGWRKPENTVVVSRPSKWGNPMSVADARFELLTRGVESPTDCDARAFAVAEFRRYLDEGTLPFTVEDVRRELRDKNLACWCPLPEPGQPDRCHAAVLLAIASGADE